jgi:hypothetical protein
MTLWRVLLCILFATSVHAALPTGHGGEEDVPYWRVDWRDSAERPGGWSVAKMDEDQRSRLVRHRTYMIEGVPEDYQGASSPFDNTGDVLASGAALYTQHCADCHGQRGRGEGDAGNSLKPSPALKTYISRRPWAADEYLLWSVAEGGVPFGSDMPAFRERLTREQIWQIIAYMRAGFPRTALEH